MLKKPLCIKIAGDFVVSNNEFTKYQISEEVVDLFGNSDINILNLECPVTDAVSAFKITKTGPHIKGNPDIIGEVLKYLRIDLVTLANNHILDFGEKGLRETLYYCDKYKIKYVGAGMNLTGAKSTFRKEINGHKISIINFAENEWASASLDRSGANPMDLIDNLRDIQEERKHSDFVIVIVHGGHEYYNLPSPRMQKQYRFYAENGASIVVGHHPHCISGSEIYKDVPIYYSLGNFLFTKPSQYDDWYKGLVLEINISQQGKMSVQSHYVQQSMENYSLTLIPNGGDDPIFSRVAMFDKAISNEAEISSLWNDYVKQRSKTYLTYFSPIAFIKNRYIKALLRKFKLRYIDDYDMSYKLNLLRCEAHSDLSKAVITQYLESQTKRSNN